MSPTESQQRIIFSKDECSLGRAMLTLCNPGEGVLTEDWTYPSALASIQPYGINAVPVTMDSEGMRSDSLRKVLGEWDETARGFKR